MTEEKRVRPASETRKPPKRRKFWLEVATMLVKRKPLGLIGLILVLALFFTGIFADLTWMGMPDIGLAPEHFNVMHLADRLSAPSPQFPLGTDHLGRDVLSRIIHGARLSMIVGVVATALSTTISTSIGMMCAYFGGWFDLIVQRFVDAWICFPALVILITLLSILQPGLLSILLVLGVASGISGARFQRSLVFAIKENAYIHASEAIGARSSRIMLTHLLPNILPMVIVLFTIGMGATIMAEASLSFLGLGLPPPYPSWGSMISGEGRAHMLKAPWLALWPGIALSLAVFGINMLGDALRDLLDPRLRGGLGSYRLEKVDKIREKLMKKQEEADPEPQEG
jgi:peptide/nickel transport system permease protein